MNEHKTRRMALGVLGGVLLLGGAVGVAVATGVPTSSPLVWGGTVTDDAGKPYDKAVEVSVAFYDGQAATTPVCESKVVNAEAKTGRFSVVLPDACAKAVHDSPDLWSETVVGPSKTKLPRVKVAAVPYALEAAVAGVAEKAGGALASEISGLSGKVDGVVKDVAGLKGGGGGTTPILVRDAAGNLLGTLLACDTYCWVLTPKNYILRLEGKLQQPYKVVMYYDAGNCTGTPYAFASGTNDLLQPMYVWTGFDGGKSRFFRPKPYASAPQSAVAITASYRYDVGVAAEVASSCKKDSYSPSFGFELEEVTGPDLGLPAQIVFPALLTTK